MASNWERFEYLLESIGAERLLLELFYAMSDDEIGENLDWICRCLDIQFPEDVADDLIVEDEISRLNMGFGTHDLDESFSI